jgi:hypothetical protein
MKKKHPVWAVVFWIYSIASLTEVSKPGAWGLVFAAIPLGYLGFRFWQGPRNQDAPKTPKRRSSPRDEIAIHKQYEKSITQNFPLPKLRVFMKYLDSSGDLTERYVQIQELQISRDGDLYLRGFCELRNEERTFRIDRINQLSVDGTSAEPEPFFRKLAKGELDV